MGRAASTGSGLARRLRERHGRLSVARRRPSGPAHPSLSPPPSGVRATRLARAWRASACLLAAGLALLLGAGAAQVANAQDSTGPAFVSATANGATVTITFDEPLDESGTVEGFGFSRTLGGVGRVNGTGTVTVSGHTATVTFATAAPHGETVEVSYSGSPSPSLRLRDLSSNQAPAFSDKTATNNTPPAFESATVSGDVLTVTFDGALDEGSVPAGSAFTVKAARSGTETTVALVPMAKNPVSINGTKVTLRLAAAVLSTDMVTVAYDEPAVDPLRDKDNLNLPVTGFDDIKAVDHFVAPPLPPSVSRARVSWDTLTVVFDRELDSTARPAGGSFLVWMDRYQQHPGGPVTSCGTPRKCWMQTRGTGTASVSGDTVTVRLEERSVIPPDATVALTYLPPQTNALRDTNGVVVKRLRWVEVQARDEGNRPEFTNPDPTPVFSRASVNGAELTVTFDRELDEGSVPPARAFMLGGNYGGHIRIGTGTVRLSGKTATVTLDSAVPYGDDLNFVNYARPARGNGLRGTDGLEVASFSGKRVTNRTPYAAPVLLSARVWVRTFLHIGTYLNIVFTEPLDDSSEPPASAFRLTVTKDGRTRTVAGTGTANISGASVNMRLAAEVASGATVKLSYVKPSANALRDRERGTPVESFSGVGVANGPPRVRVAGNRFGPGRRRHLRAGRHDSGAGEVHRAGEGGCAPRHAGAGALAGL